MANYNNKNKNKQNNNYFTNQLRNFQNKNIENFLTAMTPKDLEVDAIRILRDLAKNRINVDEFSKYFYDDKLRVALCDAVLLKMQLHSISATGVELFMQTQNAVINPTLFNQSSQVLDFHRKSASAWDIVHECVASFYNSLNLDYLKMIYSKLYAKRLVYYI